MWTRGTDGWGPITQELAIVATAPSALYLLEEIAEYYRVDCN